MLVYCWQSVKSAGQKRAVDTQVVTAVLSLTDRKGTDSRVKHSFLFPKQRRKSQLVGWRKVNKKTEEPRGIFLLRLHNSSCFKHCGCFMWLLPSLLPLITASLLKSLLWPQDSLFMKSKPLGEEAKLWQMEPEDKQAMSRHLLTVSIAHFCPST